MPLKMKNAPHKDGRSKPAMRTIDTPAVGNPADLVGHTVLLDPNRIDFGMRARANPPQDKDVLARYRSMKRIGQLADIVVAPSTDTPGKFVLVSGGHRLQAKLWERNGEKTQSIKSDSDATIRCFVVPAQTAKGNVKEQAVENFGMAVAENRERTNSTPLDDAHNYRVLKEEYRLDNNECARILGVTVGWLPVLAELAKADERIQALVADPDVRLPARKAAETVGLSEEAITEILKATHEAAKDLTNAVKYGMNEAEKAKEAAKRARTAASVKIAEKRQETPKKRAPQGRPTGDKAFRNVQEIRGLFAEVYADASAPASVKHFADLMRDFCNNKSTAKAVSKALYAIATGAPASSGPKAQGA